MSLTITYFVHGTTTDNERDIATGQAHGELSELGKKQAKELGRMIAKMRFDAVFCSDLKFHNRPTLPHTPIRIATLSFFSNPRPSPVSMSCLS